MSEHIGVDIAPEHIEAVQMQITDFIKDPSREFRVALVKQDKFYDRPICPHCSTTTVPTFVGSFSEDLGKFAGDIVICEHCENVVIPLKYPIFAHHQPIMLNWKIKP